MKLYIKYMVSRRCKNFVKDQLKKIGIDYSTVDLGMVVIPEDMGPALRLHLKIFEKRIEQVRTGIDGW